MTWISSSWQTDSMRERPRLRSVAYRIVGSVSEADDAVQEAWLRLQRTDADEIDNLEAWLTTVVARICLNILRDRRSHAEESLDAFVPEPIISTDAGDDPEHEVLLADAVGIALQVVIDALNPAERLAFVLHDMFACPIRRDRPAGRALAPGDAAARQPRPTPDPRRRAGARPRPGPTASRRRRILRRRPRGRPRRPRRGARPRRGRPLPRPRRRVRAARRRQGRARRRCMARRWAPFVRPALINGTAGAVAFDGDTPFAILAFTVSRRPRGDDRHLQRP